MPRIAGKKRARRQAKPIHSCTVLLSGWCEAHDEAALCPHACTQGRCHVGCENMTDHELRKPKEDS